MARPRKPTNVLTLKGAFKHNPHRELDRLNEPKNTAPIKRVAPKWMTKRQQECYIEVIDKSHANVISEADAVLVEMVACLLDEFRDDPRRLSNSNKVLLMTALGRLGMTPSDRSKVAVIEIPEGADPYAEFGS